MNLLQLVDPIYVPSALSSHTLLELFLLLRSLAEETGEHKLLMDGILPIVYFRTLINKDQSFNLTSFASPLLLQTIFSSMWHLSPEVVSSYGKKLAEVIEHGNLVLNGDISLVQTQIINEFKNAGNKVFFFFFRNIYTYKNLDKG
jgi:hypothetical protein